MPAALGAAVGAVLPLSRTEQDILGGTGAQAMGAGREALPRAAGVMRQEISKADIGGRVSDMADKIVQQAVGQKSGDDDPAKTKRHDGG